ncbi:hypothetical protein cypCar_00022911 [Cyprinus carpio]|nr:hypothetical protein cypCar_00022911 [Cyprinus carpio]
MGLTLIHYTTSDWVTLHICKYLQARTSQVCFNKHHTGNQDGISVPASTGSYGRMRRYSWKRAVRSPITDSSPYEVRRLWGRKGSTDAIDLIV